MKVYALSIHADYRCRHSGACCTADWDVPVEIPVYRRLDEALAAGRLQPAGACDEGPLITGPDLPDDASAMLARTPAGDCVFFHRPSGLCVVHRDLGEAALPSTCRHFPRIAVADARGISVTLSLYCPTAAGLIFREDTTLQVVESPPAFPPMAYNGLTVGRDALPPLLHPRMLMDHDGYAAWERHMVARCATETASPDAVLATLVRDARQLTAWTPDVGPLAAAVADLPDRSADAPPPASLAASLRLHGEALDAVPVGLRPEADERGLEEAYRAQVVEAWQQLHRPINRFLAVKAFASWTAYQGRGIRSIVRGLEAALAGLRVEAARACRDAGRSLDAGLLREAMRRADFLLHHLAVADELARRWSRAEREP